ncbi:hypothetical protein ABIE40_006013 [Rhizobium sp. OAE497]|jgi:hypothetical protein
MLTAARLTEPHKSHTDLKMKNCTRTVDTKRYSPDAIGEIAARCKVAGISFYPPEDGGRYGIISGDKDQEIHIDEILRDAGRIAVRPFTEGQ